MNYRKIYARIIKKAKKENREKGKGMYYEAHHIKPKSLFPAFSKTKQNIVLLTAREHYVAHKLLTKIYPCNSMLYAFMVMSSKAINNNGRRDYFVSSRDFDRLKKRFSENNPAKSSEARAKISKTKKGKNHHFYGVIAENSGAYKDDIFTFVHTDGRYLTGTRVFMCRNSELTKTEISNLITGYRYTAKGWSLNGSTKPKPKKGRYSINADLSLRCWYNKKLGIGYVCNKYDFIELVGLKMKSVNTLIYKERNSVFDWILQ